MNEAFLTRVQDPSMHEIDKKPKVKKEQAKIEAK